MDISFNDLITNQYLKKTTLNIKGVGSLELRQISASDAAEVIRGCDDLSGEELELYISEKALGFVKESKPTKSEVSKFRSLQSPYVIGQIYGHVVNSSGQPIDMDEAEKN